MMRALLALIVPCLLTITSFAQLPPKTPDKGIAGTFYVSVDDGARIFVNGKKAHDAPLNESRSGELELKVDDRVIVQLRDDGAGRRFSMAFVSADRQTVVSFRRRDYKIVPDIDVEDFTPYEFKNWSKFAKGENRKPEFPFVFKEDSDWVWGEAGKCILACVITPDMIKPMEK